MKLSMVYCFSVPISITKIVLLYYFVFAISFNEGMCHVGERCTLVIICLASNSYCDSAGICRCKPEYPINVAPHECRRGRHHGNKCHYSEECRYYDRNTYCTQTPYRSICECQPDLIYDEKKKLCVEVPPFKGNTQGVLLPIMLGVSLGIASMLCCCLAAWHFCQKHHSGEELTTFRHFTLRNRNSGSNANENRRNTQMSSSDVLPPYEMIMRENDNHLVDELPPSYEEVIKQAKLLVKT